MGISYHLSLHLNELCDPESITSLIKQHIPDAKLAAQNEENLVYILPLERTNQFPDLCRDLERCANQGIENYGVSMTTLNEVFLKLEGKSSCDESDIGIGGQVQSDGAKDMSSFVELEQVLSSLDETNTAISSMALWRLQLAAIAKVRFLKLKNERKSLMVMLLIFGISFLPHLLEHIFFELYSKSYSWGLSPNMYFLSPGQQPQEPLTSLLIINKTGSSVDNFIHSLERQNITLEVDAFGTRNGTDDPSYNGAIIVSGDDKNYRFLVTCNAKRLNCFPVIMDIISNGLLGVFNSSESIQTERSTYFEKKIHSQLQISGLYRSAYWFGQALVDGPLYFLILLLMQIMDYVLSPDEIIFIIQNLLIQILCSIGYVSSLVFMIYVISFIFRNGRKNSGIWSFFFLIITIFSAVAIDLNQYGFLGLLFCTILIPPFTRIGSLFIFSEISPDSMDYLVSAESEIVYLALLINFSKNSDIFPNPDQPEGEDGDVQVERVRTAHAVNAPDFDEKPVIIASCLRKEYTGKKKNCFSRRRGEVATRNVSFCVKKGEVIGLLGHNGAGKSTTIKMITGDIKPTAGQVLLQGSRGGDAAGFVGCCLQENALWPGLTAWEHLEVFTAVKGLRGAAARAAVTRLVDALQLQDQLKVPTKALSEGMKRKLCFTLSILGSPAAVLLNEPSTGMDPMGQQQMWRAIRATIRNTERGALLSTHYMAEAEAVCDRVAIMVSRRLRCIGSIQHLKSKFGKDYLLEMKLKTPEQGEPLHTEVLRLFPQAARQERFSSLLVYKLPIEDVKPLSQAFFKLELGGVCEHATDI